MIVNVALIVSAYLLGSVSSAILVCRFMRLPDPRSVGSGNPGATNVLRIGGKKPAVATLLGDMLKGLLPVLAGQFLGCSPVTLSLIGLAAFIGHLYPIFFRFQGGKGVATLLGVLLGMDWILGLVAIGSWLLVAYVTKISSLAALTMALLTPLYSWFLQHDWRLAAVLGVMTVLLFWRHRRNIRDLVAGEESRIGQSSDTAESDELRDVDRR